jgi:hypothetical protein
VRLLADENFVRLPLLRPSELARVVASTLESRADWVGHFSVIERSRIRMTPLPDIDVDREPEGNLG